MKIPYWPIYTGPNKDFENAIPRVKYILSKLDNPHLKLKNIIHITGTKGKGSTALYISNILMANGYKVNTYTSPHIYECNERVLLNGKKITDDQLNEATEAVRFVCEENCFNNPFNSEIIEPAMFEALTCSAFFEMAKNDADFNVIEVGMGAINDATNVFDDNPPVACVFTPIHLDHTKFLGNRIEEVALKKSFLIKKGVQSVILSSQAKETEMILTNTAKQLDVKNVLSYGKNYEVFRDKKTNTPIYNSKTFNVHFPFQRPNMPGDYQFINAGCAITAYLSLQKNGIIHNTTIEAINLGIKNTFNIVRMQTINNGNLFQKLPQGSLFYIDGAHNQLAAHALAGWIKDFKQINNDYKICIAVARTKGANNTVFLQEMLDQSNNKPIIDLLIATRANLESIPEPPEIIESAGKNLGLNCKIAYNIEDVLSTAIGTYKNQKILLICTGSLYIARDVIVANGCI